MTKQQRGFEHGHYLNCGSSVALVNETVVHLEVGGEIVKTYAGSLRNRNCVRCSYPVAYPDFGCYEGSDGQETVRGEQHA